MKALPPRFTVESLQLGVWVPWKKCRTEGEARAELGKARAQFTGEFRVVREDRTEMGW